MSNAPPPNLAPPLNLSDAAELDTAALVEFARTREAQNLERLAGDSEMVYQMALRRYEGPLWDKFAHALASYGYGVIRAWVVTGKIFTECKRKGMGLGVRVRGSDDATELASETVSVALHQFRNKVLMPGKWKAGRGASLNTFFIGRCVLDFPNVYRVWLSEQDRLPPLLQEQDREKIPDASARPRLVDLVDLSRVVRTLPVDDPRMLAGWKALGYTQEDVAEMIGVSKRSLESKLYRRRHD